MRFIRYKNKTGYEALTGTLLPKPNAIPNMVLSLKNKLIFFRKRFDGIIADLVIGGNLALFTIGAILSYEITFIFAVGSFHTPLMWRCFVHGDYFPCKLQILYSFSFFYS